MVVAISLFFFQNCSLSKPGAPLVLESSADQYASMKSTFADINQYVFKPKCLSCHSAGSPNFTSYESLMAGSSVVASNPESSSLYQQVNSGEMPKGGARLSFYEVNAINDWIRAGALSDGPVATTPPDAASALTALVLSQTEITLNWVLPSQTITGVKIERSLSNAGPFSLVANLSLSTSTYIDTGLTASTSYFYRISVNNLVGSSGYSNVASAKTSGYPPSAPTLLIAVASSQTQINLTWADNSSDETGFKIERSTSATGAYSVVATLAENSTNYSDTGLTASITYYYRVYSYIGTDNSSFSQVANATTQAPPSNPPTAASALVSTAVSSAQINLSWTDNSSDESGFKIERALSAGGAYTLIATLAPNTVSYSDTGLTASTTYYYRVYAYNMVGDSAATAVANATTQAVATTAPAAANALATSVISSSQINLTWTDNSSNESGFKIERSLSNAGPFTEIASVVANITTYSNTSLSSLTTYYYRIYAYNTAGNSAYSNTANATTLGLAPSAASNLVAVANSSSQINLTWMDNSSNETGFKIERSTSSSGPFAVIATTATNAVSYTDSTAATATTYYYRIYAFNAYGNSANSALASATAFATFAWINANIIRPTSASDATECLSCHSGTRPKGNYDQSTYTNVMTRVTPYDSANSLFYQRVIDGTMPKAGTSLSTAEKNAIKSWIDSGAPNN